MLATKTTRQVPLTVSIPLDATEQDIAEIESMMVQAFAKTENVPESVMRSLLDQFKNRSQTPRHIYIQWTRVHAKPDETYATRLMDNITKVRKN